MKFFLPMLVATFIFSTVVDAAGVNPWLLPVQTTAAQPSLSQAPDGGLNLSWIERTAKGHRLRFARFREDRWTAPVTIASGENWFVNWADFPSTTQLADGTLWAHNLIKRGAGTYAYDLVLYRSKDNGKSWSKPMTVHDDGTETEHGFATLWPWSTSEVAVAWLDGRETAGRQSGHDHNPHDQGKAKAMTLRAAVFNGSGQLTREWLLDASTCDCCQTDSALSAKGPIVIYRDRTAGEIRDIYTARFSAGQWRKPKLLAEDNWLMPACPVNGPAIAASGNSVWAAWYTGAGNEPSLRVAFSGDSGEHFKNAKTFKHGTEIQGRVDLAADAEGTWLLWTEEQAAQSLWLARLDRQLNMVGSPVRVARLAGRGRATGFARMQTIGKSVYIVWTDIIEGKPKLQGAQFRF